MVAQGWEAVVTTADYAPDSASRHRTAALKASPKQGEHDLEKLQHRAGNRAVAALVQAKLQVGAVDDPLEREADLVAKRVVAGSHRHDGPACADCGGGAAVRPAAPSALQRRATGAVGADGGAL